jgi:hypothetical protein
LWQRHARSGTAVSGKAEAERGCDEEDDQGDSNERKGGIGKESEARGKVAQAKTTIADGWCHCGECKWADCAKVCESREFDDWGGCRPI